MSKKKIFYILLGCYQVAGGMLGTYAIITGLKQQSLPVSLATILFILPYFSILIITGILIFIKRSLKLATSLTYICQAIQIIQFQILGFEFYYICGTYFNFGIIGNPIPHFFIDYSAYSIDCVIKLGSAGSGFAFLINIIPIIIIILLHEVSSSRGVKIFPKPSREKITL